MAQLSQEVCGQHESQIACMVVEFPVSFLQAASSAAPAQLIAVSDCFHTAVAEVCGHPGKSGNASPGHGVLARPV